MSEPSFANSPAATTPSVFSNAPRLAIVSPPVRSPMDGSGSSRHTNALCNDGHYLLPWVRLLHPYRHDPPGDRGQDRHRDEGCMHPGHIGEHTRCESAHRVAEIPPEPVHAHCGRSPPRRSDVTDHRQERWVDEGSSHSHEEGGHRPT